MEQKRKVCSYFPCVISMAAKTNPELYEETCGTPQDCSMPETCCTAKFYSRYPDYLTKMKEQWETDESNLEKEVDYTQRLNEVQRYKIGDDGINYLGIGAITVSPEE